MPRAKGKGLTPRQYRIYRAAKKDRAPPVEIAQRFRSSPDAIRSLLKRLRARGYDIPPASSTARARSSTMALPRWLATQLRGHAKRRGMAPRDLAVEIVSEVLRRDLLSDLLDGRPA